MDNDRPDAEIFKEKTAAESKQHDATRERLSARLRLLSFLTLRGGIVFALILAVLVLGRLAYALPERSYEQMLATEAAGGVATFLVIPWVLVLLEHFRLLGTLGAIAASMALAVAGGFAEGTSRDFLVEGSMGLALAVALEFLLHGALVKIIAAAAEASDKLREAQQKFAQAKQNILKAENELDYKYAVNDYLGIPRGYEIPGLGNNPFDPGASEDE